MKKLFTVQCVNRVGYDEYDSCVVVADSKEEVVELIENADIRGCSYYFYTPIDNTVNITEVDLNNTRSDIICSSFNAG